MPEPRGRYRVGADTGGAFTELHVLKTPSTPRYSARRYRLLHPWRRARGQPLPKPVSPVPPCRPRSGRIGRRAHRPRRSGANAAPAAVSGFMYFDRRLWGFVRPLRGRVALSVAIGLAATAVGIARLALLGWLIAQVFRGATFAELAGAMALVACVMVLRGVLEYARAMVAHGTAARIQIALRKAIYDKAVLLGPAWFGLERTGEVILAAVDGVEQLETYFGEFLRRCSSPC